MRGHGAWTAATVWLPFGRCYFLGTKSPQNMPYVFLLKLDMYDDPQLGNLPEKVVPVVPAITTWHKSRTACLRRQFLLTLPWAVTAHKSLGVTPAKAVIDLGPSVFAFGIACGVYPHL